MISIKNSAEIEMMRQAGRLLAEVMEKISLEVKPGFFTLDLDKMAEDLISQRGARPAFKGYGDRRNPYAHTICVSFNHQVVHAAPQKNQIFKAGDIVGIDCGLEFQGYYADMAITIGVGKISCLAEKLIKTTKEALNQAIIKAKTGAFLGDVSWAIQSFVEKNGFSVVRQLCGHGIGKNLHEEPDVLNYGQPGTGIVLKSGMVLAVEPMVNVGSWEVKTLSDGWTVVTKDNTLSAHFEHTILVTDEGGVVLTECHSNKNKKEG